MYLSIFFCNFFRRFIFDKWKEAFILKSRFPLHRENVFFLTFQVIVIMDFCPNGSERQKKEKKKEKNNKNKVK